jgi:hypothetical protein
VTSTDQLEETTPSLGQLRQQLLQGAGAQDLPGDIVEVEPCGVELAADCDQLGSPETYPDAGGCDAITE